MKHITNDQFVNSLKICQKGKHKLRENNFGVVFCTRCGLLSTSVGAVEKLTEDDKIKVVKNLQIKKLVLSLHQLNTLNIKQLWKDTIQ